MYYYYDCGICGCLHPAQFAGDCRDDANRFASDELDEKHGAYGWTEIEMVNADNYPAVAV